VGEKDTVYVLHHVRTDDAFGEDAKLIGVYRSQGAAEDAVLRLMVQPGFCDNPEGFTIDGYRLDQDHWQDGFETI
jgi:hypothetical protein